MTNILNSIIANQPIYPNKKDDMPVFTFNSAGKIKPMKDKGTLLPSKIFGSPVEYVKDLKKDVVNIGRAAKGQANDHELGRINDIAMKLGSLGLAAYLFVKNPKKLSKTMEFVGFGTFFASMALWPKLAIQAPLKARTGVDIHQKYIDSQGRKKMLYQDPQYVLTDLYSKEDLEKIGNKLGVSKDIPDRDNFIKQRAQKTALQGNTLWMMTAGIASPVMSALACNKLEKPINAAIEKVDMIASERALQSGKYQGVFGKIKQRISDKLFDKFISRNADRVLDDKFISELSEKIGGRLNSATVGSTIREELAALKGSVTVDMGFVKNALKSKVPESVYASLSEETRAALDTAIASKSFGRIGNILAKASGATKTEQKKLSKELTKILTNKSNVRPTLGQVSQTVRKLYDGVTEFAKGKGAIDRYITARVGDKSGTYIANQWEKVTKRFMKSMHFSMRELKELSTGNMTALIEKMDALSKNPEQCDKTVVRLMRLIGDYEKKTGEVFTDTIRDKSSEIYTAASEGLRSQGFTRVAEKISTGAAAQAGTLQNIIQENAAERVSGAQSSFYRLIQSLDLFRRVNSGTLKTQLNDALSAGGQKVSPSRLTELVTACKHLLLSGTTTDHVEKLKTAGFKLTEAEYKAVMDVVFKDSASLAQGVQGAVGAEQAQGMLKGIGKYFRTFKTKIANWQNTITPDLSRRVSEGIENAPGVSNAIERNNLVAKPIQTMVQDIAKQTYNSKKWLHIFGGTMLALTAVTLIAGLAIGRKGETEKQVEAESRRNG